MTNKDPLVNMVAMKRFIPLGLMGAGLFLIIGTIGFWIFNQKIQHPSSVPLPGMIADLPLSESFKAEQAIAEFTQMHGEDFPLTSGAVGMYGVEHSVTLWVAGAPITPVADRMLVAMHDRIANTSGTSPFSLVGERLDRARKVYELDGMGQKHFFFQSGNLIVWLAVAPERADEILPEILEFYP